MQAKPQHYVSIATCIAHCHCLSARHTPCHLLPTDIKSGQGMYYSPASKQYSAVNCSSNSYGVANTTYGLGAYPCRDCPAGMQTSTSLPSSAAFYFSEGDVAGFTNPMACVTKPGYGYNGRVATACPAGSYNAAGNYGTCTKCAAGFSTPANPEQQVSVDNCAVAQGYGLHDNAIVPCPVGECHCCKRVAGAQCVRHAPISAAWCDAVVQALHCAFNAGSAR